MHSILAQAGCEVFAKNNEYYSNVVGFQRNNIRESNKGGEKSPLFLLIRRLGPRAVSSRDFHNLKPSVNVKNGRLVALSKTTY
jgi:hypothetical protein